MCILQFKLVWVICLFVLFAPTPIRCAPARAY